MNTPFDTIESAQEFLGLLREAVDEAKHNADGDIVAEADLASLRSPRRIDALRVVVYKLEKLEQHLKISCRLLNDLRTLRRLLLAERSESAIETEAVQTKAKVRPPLELPKSPAAAKPRAIAV